MKCHVDFTVVNKADPNSRFIADKYWVTPREEGYGVSDGVRPSMQREKCSTHLFHVKRITRARKHWFVQGLPNLHFAKQLAYILSATRV